MIISRLLSPEDIGIYSVAVGLTAAVAAFRDFGAGSYLVTVRELSSDAVKSVWTIMFLFGLALTFVVICVGYIAGGLYKNYTVSLVIYVSAFSFLLTPFSSIKYALLMRKMKYKKLAFVRMFGSLSAAVVSILLIYFGYGPVSLAVGSIASILLVTIMLQFYGESVSYFALSFRDLKKLIKFGSALSSINILKSIVLSLPELVIGKMHSFHMAGLFSRGVGLSQMVHRLILDATSPVIISKFSEMYRNNEDVKDVFWTYNLIIVTSVWLLLSFIGCNANELMLVMYGSQWDDAVVYTQLSCVWLALAIIPVNSDNLLMAKHEMKAYFSLSMVGIALRASAVIIGSFFGVEEVLIALCISAIFYIPYVFYSVRHIVVIQTKLVLTRYFNSLLIVASLVAFNCIFSFHFELYNAIVILCIKFVMSFLIVCALSWLTAGVLNDVLDTLLLKIKSLLFR